MLVGAALAAELSSIEAQANAAMDLETVHFKAMPLSSSQEGPKPNLFAPERMKRKLPTVVAK
jgi:hypothetical protein